MLARELARLFLGLDTRRHRLFLKLVLAEFPKRRL